MTTGPSPRRDPVLVLILLGSLALNTHRIGHPGLHYFDESFHAIVARNLLKHPLTPTLVDAPYLPYDPTRWGEARVWLHKPILPLWTIAASYALLGVNTTALRLPSALLATGAVALTFLIGRILFDRRTALIAAGLQAICPAITMLLQGYLFSDHVDIALLFWVEVGVFFLIRAIRSGSWPDVLAVGVAQGLAYLSKSYLAAILTGLAATAWALPRVGLSGPDESRLKLRHLLGLVGATLATVAPWTIHCARSFPVEFAHEHGYIFTHLGDGVEGWGGPWDRLFFDYLITLYHAFYTPLIVAGMALARTALARRRMPLLFVFAWFLGVLAPHAISATKTPSATLIAMPAGFLLLGHLIAEGWRGQRRSLAAWAAVAILAALWPAPIARFGKGYPSTFGGVMLGAPWVLGHVALALGVAGMLSRRSLANPGCRRLRLAALAATLVIAGRVALAAWSVTEGTENQPFVAELAGFARGRLPDNSVLLFEGEDRGEHQLAMFLLDRTCYQLRGRPADEVARQVRDAGGRPFLVTAGPAAWPRWFAGTHDPRSLYEWQGHPVASGAHHRPAR